LMSLPTRVCRGEKSDVCAVSDQIAERAWSVYERDSRTRRMYMHPLC
jgi:hypothetical protein